jgi:hypothetical protein
MNKRIGYIEGSSLPHFTGEPGTMTADEAQELVAMRDLAPVAEEMQRLLELYMREKLPFEVSTSRVARKVMGNDRPLHDDDSEYFDFCDRVYDMIRRRIEIGINEAVHYYKSGGIR